MPVIASSSSEKLSSASEESSSSVDSGVAGHSFPSAHVILQALTCSSFLFLAAIDFAFLRDRRLRGVALAAHPCKRNQVRI